MCNTEEHNIETANAEDSEERRESRAQFQELFEQFGRNNPQFNPELIELFQNMLSPLLQSQWHPEDREKGCSQEFIDSLPRVPRNKVPLTDTCSICFERFGNDNYPLLAQLPHCGHIFDLQCISMWLSNQVTCPMCRDVVNGHKVQDLDTSKAELEEDWGMYG
ncbi:uncharacterized protein KNAG_0J00850 [Huiozyma naganishii CBS 8797]|uniref:RING-type domain-containing protein n=1 Tax=Huiozyma naganishii (strain ATCC MYA-139 / BCRC 22969 / CBS 8797 / KCTC 17520 / NBRC 10181 / NCYC 3082 / Yp74L-3) TaxID=1071383 RepID=J7S2P5_HUIN7|nr:hypothetical protein KNAG_0J00850 [Kazachstania naganishii CBS 8797]CCK72167.1 hypothetical protein KNAG_0J00850 [Kazachstania naganishii CBS 8797]